MKDKPIRKKKVVLTKAQGSDGHFKPEPRIADRNMHRDISSLSLDEILGLHSETVETLERTRKVANVTDDTKGVFILTEKQDVALTYLNDNVTTSIGFGGGAGGAKTILGVLWIINNSLKYPGTSWAVGRKNYTSLERTTKQSFFEVTKMLGIGDADYKNNSQKNTVTFNNGSIVYFIDLDYKPSDPLFTKLGGLEITGAFVDESNEVSMKALEILSTRIGRKKNKQYGILGKMLQAFNPDKGHVYTNFYEPFVKGTLPDHVKFVPALAIDNPYLDRNYIKNLWNKEEISKQRLLFGNFDFDDSDDALITMIDIMNLYTNTVEDTSQKYLIVDIADGGKDLTIFSYFKGLEVYDIQYFHSLKTHQIIENIRTETFNRKIPMVNVAADGIGVGAGVVSSPLLAGMYGFKSSYAPIQNQKNHTHKVNKWDEAVIEHDFVKTGYKNLRSQCGFELARKIKLGEFSIKVPNTEITINNKQFKLHDRINRELSQLRDKTYGQDEVNKQLVGKDEIKEFLGFSPDFVDTFIMRMYFEIVKDFEISFIRKTKALIERKFYKTKTNKNKYA